MAIGLTSSRYLGENVQGGSGFIVRLSTQVGFEPALLQITSTTRGLSELIEEVGVRANSQ